MMISQDSLHRPRETEEVGHASPILNVFPPESSEYPFWLREAAMLRCRLFDPKSFIGACEASAIACSAGGIRLVVHDRRAESFGDGRQFRICVAFPLQPSVTLPGRSVTVIRAGETAGRELIFDLRFRTDAREGRLWRARLAEHLLRYGGVENPAALRAAGLPVPSVQPFVRYRLVETAEDYEEAIQVRQDANWSAGKLKGQSDLRDRFDNGALILIGEYRGKVAATLRVITPDQEWEHLTFFDWPDSFPDRKQVVEIGRLGVHPDWQRSDIVLGLFKQAAAVILRSGQRWIMGSARAYLLPLYAGIGCVPTSLDYYHPGDLARQVVFLADLHGIGGGTNPFTWAIIWADVARFAFSNCLLPEPTGLRSLRLRSLQRMDPILLKLGLRLYDRRRRARTRK